MDGEQASAWIEYEAQENERCEHGVLPEDYCGDCNPCDSGWCGDSACYRCNPWGYPR